MKKILSFIFAIVLCVPLAFLVASCGGDTKVIKSISLDTTNTPAIFLQGNNFTFEGLEVYGVHKDETKEKIDKFTVDSSNFKKNAEGVYKIIVSYNDLNTSYNVEVKNQEHFVDYLLEATKNDDYTWVENTMLTDSYVDDAKILGRGIQFFAQHYLYSKQEDFGLPNDWKVEERWLGETWLTADFIFYHLTDNKGEKKEFFAMEEATDFMQLGFSLQDGIKFVADQVIGENGFEYSVSNDKIYSINFDNKNKEIVITFFDPLADDSENDYQNQKTIYVFDWTNFRVKRMSYSDLRKDEETSNYYSYGHYIYFNVTPTERMITPPTNVQWETLD